MKTDALQRAKQSLRIPELWRRLNLPGEAAKSCRCPWREDQHPSFSVFDDGLRWHDFGTSEGGDAVDFLAKARGLSKGDACREFLALAGVRPAKHAPQVPRRVVEVYDYRDESGQLLYQVIRFEPKDFCARRPDPGALHGWISNLDGVRRVPYRLPELRAAVSAGERVYIAEGEKDVNALVSHGFAATCNSGGAGQWDPTFNQFLLGADVVVVQDKDKNGRKHGYKVACSLYTQARSLKLVELPDWNGHPVKDAADFFGAGASADDLPALVAQAPLFTPGAGQSAEPQALDREFAAEAPEERPFPTDCLPPVVALMVRSVARLLCVPDALPGLNALALVAAGIGKGLVLDWRPGKAHTPANLFVILSAESGSGKSETFKLLATPFLTFERALQEHWRRQVLPQLQADLRFTEGQLKRLDRKLAKDNLTPEDAERFRGEQQFHLARKVELESMLHEPQLSIQDATVEKAATVMHANAETIFSTSSDARKLADNLLGRYSKNGLADDGIYLCAFSGDDVKVDRQGREPVRLASPCLTLFWALQPDALEMLLGEDSLQQGGFLARCLIAHTHAEPQPINREPLGLADSVRDAWDGLLRSLLGAYRQPPCVVPDKEAASDAPDVAKTFVVAAAADAREALFTYHDEVVAQRKTGNLEDVGQYASRWCEQAARLALVLHAGLHGQQAHQYPLSSETATNAVSLVKWFSEQQLGLLAKGRRARAAEVEAQVLDLLEANRERKGQDYVTVRDVQRARLALTAEQARALLERLEREGILASEDARPSGGGKSARIFRRITNPVPE